MSIIRVISNPNIGNGANRAPGKTELATIRALIKEKEEMMSHFDLQLEKANAMLVNVRNPYNEQPAGLECTLSELGATRDSVKMLENQKETVKTDLDKLRGLAHPIRRCNKDILQYIFEWASRLSEPYKFKCATSISHVCRCWRNLALGTPELWTQIDIRTGRKPADIKSFWDRTVSRIVRGIPPTIHLDFSGSDSEQKALEAFGFRGIHHIHFLDIELDNEASAKRLFDLSLEHLSVDVLHLNMVMSSTVIGDKPAFAEGILTFLRKLQNLTNIYIYGPLLLSLTTGSSPFPNVKRLKAADTVDSEDTISLTLLARLFPNIETLELSSQYFTLDHPGDMFWPMVRTLIVECTYGSWADLRLPSLNTLSVTIDDDMDEDLQKLCILINNHSSLQHLTLWQPFDKLSEILNTISYLDILTVGYWYGVDDPSHSSLGKVRDLRIYAPSLTSAILKNIVKNRFNGANSDTPHADGTKTSAILRILIRFSDKEKEPDWVNSEILSQTLENVTEIELEGLLYTSYNLRLYKA